MNKKLKIYAVTLLSVGMLVGCDESDIDEIDANSSETNNEEVADNDTDIKVEVKVEDDAVESVDKHDYIDSALGDIDVLNTSIKDVVELSKEVVEDNTLLVDDDWVDEYIMLFAPMHLISEKINNIELDSLPLELHDTHRELVNSVSMMSDSGYLIQESLQGDLDIEKYKEGLNVMMDSVRGMIDVVEMLEKDKN